MANYDILSETGYKRICTCANMVSDITVIIEDNAMSTDNTWSSQKIVKEILNVKNFLREYIKEDDLNKIDVSVSNTMPTEEKMKENTLYIIKVFDDENITEVLYYKVYMKFGPNIVFLGDTNIGQDTMYTKEESDTNFLCAQVVELDNQKGLSSGALYRVFKQAIPVKVGTEDVYPILCDRKNNTHAEKYIVAVQNWTDRVEGSVVYKIINGICTVKIDLEFTEYMSDLLEYDIINDGMLPPPAQLLGDASPCGVLASDCNLSRTTRPLHNSEVFCWITMKGGVRIFGDGLEDNRYHRIYKGSFSYPVM
jgi:hypothetical protein